MHELFSTLNIVSITYRDFHLQGVSDEGLNLHKLVLLEVDSHQKEHLTIRAMTLAGPLKVWKPFHQPLEPPHNSLLAFFYAVSKKGDNKTFCMICGPSCRENEWPIDSPSIAAYPLNFFFASIKCV